MSDNEPSALFANSTLYQKIASVCAVILAGASLIMTAYWAHGPNTSNGYLGGLNWGKEIFNWHPVLMVAGSIFCLITSLLSFRVLPLPKLLQKSLHGIAHTAAMVCMSVGLAAVFYASNDKDKNSYNSYSDNFNTIHSFVGLAVFILYGLNFVLGILHYAVPVLDISLRKSFMSTHVFLGIVILLLAVSAVQTGIMMVTSGCQYEVTSPDTNPAEHYHLLSNGCQLANSIGIVCMAAAVLCYYSIFRNGVVPPPAQPKTVELSK